MIIPRQIAILNMDIKWFIYINVLSQNVAFIISEYLRGNSSTLETIKGKK